jgi:hypothetical protein
MPERYTDGTAPVSYTLDGDELRTEFPDGSYRDTCISNQFDDVDFTVTDVHIPAIAGYGVRPDMWRLGAYTMYTNCWSWLIFDNTDNTSQTLENNVLEIIKFSSNAIQSVIGIPHGDHYWIRRLHVGESGGIADITRQASGDGWTSDRNYYLFLSGHLQGLLFMSNFMPVQLSRYMHIMQGNVQLSSKLKGKLRERNRLLKRGLLFEEQGFAERTELWHSYLEHRLTVTLVLRMLERFGVSKPKGEYSWMLRTFDSWREQYRGYTMLSYQARIAAVEAGINPRVTRGGL